jgi:hypothetical protein
MKLQQDILKVFGIDPKFIKEAVITINSKGVFIQTTSIVLNFDAKLYDNVITNYRIEKI